MKEIVTFTLEPSQIEKILFEYYFGSCDEKTKQQISNTFKIEYEVTNKIGLMSYAKSVEFVLEYYTKADFFEGSICKEIILSLKDLNNIINEKIYSEGYEIDYLDVKSSYEDGSLICLLYNLKTKQKVKTKTKSGGIK